LSELLSVVAVGLMLSLFLGLLRVVRGPGAGDRMLAPDVALAEAAMVRLMNSLSMALPISEQDKQVLLETVEPAQG